MRKFFYMAMALFVSMACLTSCGDDDKDKVEDAIEDLIAGKTKPTVTIAEKSNQLVLTAVWTNLYTEVHTATFDSSDNLTSYIATYTYATGALADEAWRNAQNVPEMLGKMSRDGKVITEDLTSDFQGMTKSLIKMTFETMKSGYESDWNAGS